MQTLKGKVAIIGGGSRGAARGIALAHIRGDLRTSAFTSAFGKQYPHTFVDGEAGAGFGAHDHAPAQQHATAPAAHVPSSAGSNRGSTGTELA